MTVPIYFWLEIEGPELIPAAVVRKMQSKSSLKNISHFDKTRPLGFFFVSCKLKRRNLCTVKKKKKVDTTVGISLRELSGLLLHFLLKCGDRKKEVAWNIDWRGIFCYSSVFFSRTEDGGDYRKRFFWYFCYTTVGELSRHHKHRLVPHSYMDILFKSIYSYEETWGISWVKPLLLNKTRLWVTRIDTTNVSKIHLASQIILMQEKVFYSERMQMRRLLWVCSQINMTGF